MSKHAENENNEYNITDSENVSLNEQFSVKEDTAFTEENLHEVENTNANEENQYNQTNSSEKKNKNKTVNLLGSAWNGGAAMLATAATVLVVATSTGTDNKTINEIKNTLKGNAVHTQVSSFSDIIKVWNNDPEGPHDYNEDDIILIDEGDCIHPKVYGVKCADCGVLKTMKAEAGGHTEGEIVRENEHAGSCTEPKTYDEVIYCSICGEELSRKKISVATGGHSPTEATLENIVEETCTIGKSYDNVIYCGICGEELSRNHIETEPNGHKSAEPVTENTRKATCTSPDSHDNVIYCSVCHELLSRETITGKALGHSFSESFINAMDDDRIESSDFPLYPCVTCKNCGENAINVTFNENTNEITAVINQAFLDEIKKISPEYSIGSYRWNVYEDYDGDISGFDEVEYTGNKMTYEIDPNNWYAPGARIVFYVSKERYIMSDYVKILPDELVRD